MAMVAITFIIHLSADHVPCDITSISVSNSYLCLLLFIYLFMHKQGCLGILGIPIASHIRLCALYRQSIKIFNLLHRVFTYQSDFSRLCLLAWPCSTCWHLCIFLSRTSFLGEPGRKKSAVDSSPASMLAGTEITPQQLSLIWEHWSNIYLSCAD